MALTVAFPADSDHVVIGVVPGEFVNDVMAMVDLELLKPVSDPIIATVPALELIALQNIDSTLMPISGGQQFLVGQFAAVTFTP